MKPQDILFVVIAGAIVFFRRSWLLPAGLVCLALAVPLFATWTFFTAERLTWYGSFFILCFLCEQIWNFRRGHRE